jgi:hypothetical protein
MKVLGEFRVLGVELKVEYHFEFLVNSQSGGGSKLREEGKNYVYVLLKK